MFILIFSTCCALFAANEPAPTPSAAGCPPVPDVLVMVIGVPSTGTGPAQSMVSLNYSTAVPDAQVKSDMDALAGETHWPVREMQVSTKSAETPGAVPTTSTVFHTDYLADNTNGTLPLAPFVNTLKRFKSIRVIYFLPQDFVYQGPIDHENRYVKVNAAASPGTVEYCVQIKDPGFTKVDIPLKRPARASQQPESTGMPLGAKLLFVVAIAIAGAALAYLLTVFFSGRRRSQDAGSSDKSDE